jgi:hypothetical protein
MRHRVEADRAQTQCVFDSAGYLCEGEGLQQPQPLDTPGRIEASERLSHRGPGFAVRHFELLP